MPPSERRIRSLPTASALLLVFLPELGCFVSFDGYGPLEDKPDASVGGTSATGGAAATGGMGGQSSGGATGGATTGAGGQSSGGAVGAGGSSTGGVANSGGTSAGGATASGGLAATGGTASGGASTGGAGVTGGAPGTGGLATGGASTGGAGTGGSTVNCPGSLAGPRMIEVPRPGGTYCIDQTEVTNENYAAFLASNPNPQGQDAECAWNTSFVPTSTNNTEPCRVVQYDPTNKPKVPVSCIDWCDAKRYCQWAGKRLCGAMDGASLAPSDFANAAKSQWYSACSRAGTRDFPYGDVHDPEACADLDNASGTGTHASDVMSFAGCTGGYTALFDMSGNVAEWEDSCAASSGAADSCLVRGGYLFSSAATPPTTLCHSSVANDTTPSPATARRDQRSEFIGIRCCYDL